MVDQPKDVITKKKVISLDEFRISDNRDQKIIEKEIRQGWKIDKNFNKNALKRYVDGECPRQSFLYLPNTPQWRIDEEQPEPRIPRRAGSKFALKEGHKFEQKIYSQLRKLPNVGFKLSSKTNIIVKYTLNASILRDLYLKLSKNSISEFILLEAEFDPSEALVEQIFPKKNPADPLAVPYSKFRPDILMIHKRNNQKVNNQKLTENEIFELTTTGKIRKLPPQELSSRFAISTIDIKHVNETNVGKSHFIEILFYMHALAWFLKTQGLDKHYFVSIEYNGILPDIESSEIEEIKEQQGIIEKSIIIKWNTISRLYKDTIQVFQNLWKQAPCHIDDVSVNIQPRCGSCQFLNDCLIRLGYLIKIYDPEDLDHPEKLVITKNPRDISLKLIPHSSPSIAAQLEQYGFRTVGDVANNIDKIVFGNTPEPLFAELPLIKNKAIGLAKQIPIYPDPGRTYSYAIPRYSPINLVFAIESDPLNERVFGVGIFLEMFLPKKSKTYKLFHQWWRIWKDALDNKLKPLEILKNLQKSNPIYDILDLKTVIQLNNSLTSEIPLQIFLEGEMSERGKKKEKIKNKHTTVKYSFSEVNKSLSGEFQLTLVIIDKIYRILEICSIIENYLVIEKPVKFKKKEYIRRYRTDLALYYWGSEQLDNLKEMMERNISKLLASNVIEKKMLRIIQFFSPSDSEVSHPNQHKKIFNLQKFMETIVGFPAIINYTWHGIAANYFNSKFKKKFWIDHFNYMDYQVWHQYLETSEIVDKEERKSKIKFQLERKAKTINRLKKKFQIDVNESIPYESKAISITDFDNIRLPADFHNIAHMWYFFSRLTGAMDELEKEEIRTMYPEYSIGKLSAANVGNLYYINVSGKDPYYIFDLTAMSSNMKLKSKDRVLLIPNEFRDRKMGVWKYLWIVTIEKLVWNAKIDGYNVKTYPHKHDLIKLYKTSVDNPIENPTWYIYPIAMDAWSKKLFGSKNGGLLETCNFGDSKLGHRLTFLWDIGSQTTQSSFSSGKFSSNEIYLYYPQLLTRSNLKPKTYIPISGKKINILLTTANPPPDFSQQSAIQNALNNFIYAIQGPPGTGKSQTIAALIDEYCCRIQRMSTKSTKSSDSKVTIPRRILVTAFSYAALRVMIEKIRKSRDLKDNPTKAAQLQLIYLHSGTEGAIEHDPSYPDVDDLIHKSSGTWLWNGESRTITKKKPLENHLADGFILFSNAHQLYHLPTRVLSDFHFDLIIVDEASQVPTDQFLASLQFLNSQEINLASSGKFITKKQNKYTDNKASNLQISELMIINEEAINPDLLTQVVIVGDYFQLPPVQPVDPPKNVETILGSLYSYYVKEHHIPQTQLKINYRSNVDIVDFTKTLLIYDDLEAFSKTGNQTLKCPLPLDADIWIKEVLDPTKIVTAIIHEGDYEIAVSPIEAQLITQLTLAYWFAINPQTVEEEKKFWLEYIGIVAPHNAQGRQIIHQLFIAMRNPVRTTLLNDDELRKCLQATIYSVEKFQGSDRNLIIASVGISDRDQLKKEEEFIFDLNRFNVLTSRAKHKIIYICSRNFLDFMPKDKQMIEYAAQAYNYAYLFCNQEKPLFFRHSNGIQDYFYFRWHSKEVTTQITPCSTFHYEGLIEGDEWKTTTSSNKYFRSLISLVPSSKIHIEDLENASCVKSTMKIDDYELLRNIIPTPSNIVREMNRNLAGTKLSIDTASSSGTCDSPSDEKKSKKIEEKLAEKRININLSDEDDELF
ncbi:MAG: DEAD/DEAH box helicase [Promethearchaeota archaeon]